MSIPLLSRLPNLCPLPTFGEPMNFVPPGSNSGDPPPFPGDFLPNSPREQPRRPAARVLAVIAATGITTSFGALFVADAPTMEYVTTRVGEQRTVHIPGGSTIFVNTDSRIRLRPDGRNLRVEVFRGEALFHMLPNPERRLIVSARDIDIRDIATIFDVRLTDDGTRIVVQEGEVQLSATGLARVQLRQNQQAVVDHGPNLLRIHTHQLPADEIGRLLSWVDGQLTFKCEKLSVAVREINRYNALKLEIMDLTTADMQIGGQFSPTDPESFATGIAAMSGAIHMESGKNASGAPVLRLSQITHPPQPGPTPSKCVPDSLLGEP